MERRRGKLAGIVGPGTRRRRRSIKEGNGSMQTYKKIMDGLAFVEKVVISVVLVFVTALTFLNAVLRKLGEVVEVDQIAWTEEIVINLFVLLIMFGCALAIRTGGLITLSLVFDRLKRKGQTVLVWIITVVNCAFWVLLMKTGIDKVINQIGTGKRTPILGYPEWIFTVFLPIGAVLLIVHTIEYLVDFVSAKPEDGSEKGGAEA